MSTSRWLTWTPGASIIEKTPEPELTKPTKPDSVSFVSPQAGIFPIIETAKDDAQSTVEVPPACRCSKWSFPHFHSPEDRQVAIRRWNRESRHSVPLSPSTVQ